MLVKYNLDKLMKEKGFSLNRLAERSEVSINTLREIKNSGSNNVQVYTLIKIAGALDCSIHDLIDDDPWNYYYETLSEDRKKSLTKINQYFSSCNINYIHKALYKIGIASDITRTDFLKSLLIESKSDIFPVSRNIYLRINQTLNNLEVINFDVMVNQEVFSEQFIKRSLLDVIEAYALKNNIDNIIFYNMNGDTPFSYESSFDGSINFHSDPELDKMILKSYSYKSHDLPFPLPKDATWSKKLNNANSSQESSYL